ncbi:MAG: arylsulfatase [Bryobacterales bacterium]|nr:arylsulfatase [Bryobacterales bacterium]
MNRREFLAATAAATQAMAADASMRPNIVIILSDDFGYGSPNCYGSEEKHVRTPHLNRLAREGVRFTDANTPSSVCTPTRYAVMTGRYCWRTGLKSGVLGITAPLHIETTRMTLASMLKSRGYSTAAVGKWHLGYGEGGTDYAGALRPGPLQIGFDYHFGVPQNHGDATGVFVENEQVVGLRSKKVEPFGRTPYGRAFLGIDAPHRTDDTVMDVLTSKAVEWLGKQERGKPFFLYFTPVAVHEPTTPSRETKGTSGAGPAGDWIHDLDGSVGRILEALADGGHADETLVIFTSDNGAVLLTEGDRAEAVAYRAGLRVNGAWRGRKHGIYEGGFRVPFLVRWPGHAPAGTVCGETINLVDLAATLAALTGAALPAADKGAEDSFNVLPTFLGKKVRGPLRGPMITHNVDGVFAIRQGPWKYIEGIPAIPAGKVPAARKGETEAQLYNLERDPGERDNVIAGNAKTAARLKALLEKSRAEGRTRA